MINNYFLCYLVSTVSGDMNDHLITFEQSLSEDSSDDVEEVAKTMMVFMVRGLFSRLRFPYAQFARQSVTGELLLHPFWHAVARFGTYGVQGIIY